ncbi:hypothetical protein MA16_Dca000797 [Dendrobium catenatum]|uniref:Vps16 N-terminal domain-containing protein n=1 Tax=Dendrobium catenatum TaxID=906689 RepID=A0A2I0WUW9_9ASPA|nr:hypothetical protein MA16_Dca000797 [Dendrobium catenatum]
MIKVPMSKNIELSSNILNNVEGIDEGQKNNEDLKRVKKCESAILCNCVDKGELDSAIPHQPIKTVLNIFCVSDFKNPQPCKLADPALEDYPLCIAVIEPQYTMHGNVEVLLGVEDHVLAVEEDGIQQLGVGVGPLQKMAVSPNGKYLAAFTHNGRLLVIPTDFSRIISEYCCEADENLRMIRASLPEAVEVCIDAAGHEFDVSRQLTLLRAACYGRAFCSTEASSSILQCRASARLLGGVQTLLVPFNIVDFYRSEVVIMHWTCTKMLASAAIDDAALLEILLDKLKLCKGISYAAIAAHADNSGRRKLAAMLVDHEPLSSKKVLKFLEVLIAL